MIVTDLHQVTARFGGEVRGHRAYIPGPGHSHEDRSLAVWLCETSPLGVMTHSFAGDPWPTCNDYIASGFGAGHDYWRTARRADPEEIRRLTEARRRSEARARAAAARRQAQARAICSAGQDPIGTPVERHLNRRRLTLPAEIAGAALFYHPDCPWEQDTAHAQVAPLTCIATGRVIGVHRTALTLDGTKLGRKMLGTAEGAAVMLDPMSAVTETLHVAEGIETALAAREHYGLAPIWALGTSGAIGRLPVLPNVQRLVVIGENDAGASRKAVEAVGARWSTTGRTVEIIWPPTGAKDLNDAVMGGASA
ncbi:toprim domain-containing protein [Methylobacterium sp. E-065]|uniref:DUF7146 domain-containing protein n=1 Tax=Methylobacterium sp. E-065 TaxID=2836583 RepID=UPI001FBB539B|nr:toprim domain-containing protein [Methylobacterium sp. E-065]MCJ2020509.1 toprim domain-containing protein [Methylobacterium sp. E-065]